MVNDLTDEFEAAPNLSIFVFNEEVFRPAVDVIGHILVETASGWVFTRRYRGKTWVYRPHERIECGVSTISAKDTVEIRTG